MELGHLRYYATTLLRYYVAVAQELNVRQAATDCICHSPL
jgi:hypothetical protein